MFEGEWLCRIAMQALSVGGALIAHQRHPWLRNLFLDSLKQTTGAEIQKIVFYSSVGRSML